MSENFNALDMNNLIGEPLKAATNASINLCQSTVKFIDTIDFPNNNQTRNTSFKYYTKDIDSNEQPAEYQVAIEASLIPILPVDDANILFDIIAKLSRFSQNAKDSNITPSPAVAIDNTSSHSNNTHRSDNSAKHYVNVCDTSHDIPEDIPKDISSVLDMLDNAIYPSPIKEISDK